MTIQIKIPSPTHPGDCSTFDVGLEYTGGINTSRLQPQAWRAYILSGRRHVEFRTDGVEGFGATIDEAVAQLAYDLSVRLRVVLESRPQNEEIAKIVFDAYDVLHKLEQPGAHGDVVRVEVSLKDIAAAVGPELFKRGWTFQEFKYHNDVHSTTQLLNRREILR